MTQLDRLRNFLQDHAMGPLALGPIVGAIFAMPFGTISFWIVGGNVAAMVGLYFLLNRKSKSYFHSTPAPVSLHLKAIRIFLAHVIACLFYTAPHGISGLIFPLPIDNWPSHLALLFAGGLAFTLFFKLLIKVKVKQAAAKFRKELKS
ncbi:hypothetical protein [Terasakiella pusilla]|uniref:hypothetical protein n=1 Tax=Terasakiella pusilla TaxID=64973 RepID=UPI003AA959AB